MNYNREKWIENMITASFGIGVVLFASLLFCLGLSSSKSVKGNTTYKEMGARAYRAGANAEANPFDPSMSCAKLEWLEGWIEASELEKEVGKR